MYVIQSEDQSLFFPEDRSFALKTETRDDDGSMRLEHPHLIWFVVFGTGEDKVLLHRRALTYAHANRLLERLTRELWEKKCVVVEHWLEKTREAAPE